MTLIDITTEQHYLKYTRLRQLMVKNTRLKLVKSLYKNEESLKELFKKDQHLNNINMRKIDDMFYIVAPLIAKGLNGGVSLAESCSFLKSILIYDILKIKPIFEESIKDYDKKRRLWLDSKEYKKGVSISKYFIDNNLI